MMGLEFRLTECVLVLAVFLCFFPNHPQYVASQQAKKKPKIQYIKGVLPFLEKKEEKPLFHDAVLNSNLTNQLSAARYMLNLYKSLNTDEDNSQSFRFNVSNVTNTKAIQGADTIMGILNDATDNKVKTSKFRMRLKFNFTAKISSDDSVEAAEFHIFKDKPKNDWMLNTTFKVKLSVIEMPGNPTKLSAELGSRDIQGWETGWEIFDVTNTVDNWIVSPGNNYGLELSVVFPRVNFPLPVEPTDLGFRDFKGPYGQRPFIVSFFNGDPTEQGIVVHASERKKRSIFNPGKLRYGNRASSTECKKRRLYVDFHELRWQNWIIAPDGYESSYCAGECNYAMYNTRNTTNHAIVQMLVNLFNPYSAPGPCCAPTKLNAISVLYYDERKNVILKKFQDMVVKSCGCH